MKKIHKVLLIACCCFVTMQMYAQQNSAPRTNQFADVTVTAGNKQGAVAGSYVYNWRIGKNRKLEVGIGARVTSYFGVKTNFITAPARLARSSTTPFLIFFAGQETQNWDTLTVQRPFTSSLNTTVNFGYHLGKSWYAGFNIDLFGITIGRKGSAILTSNGETQNEANASPAMYNLLLTGDHDIGTLNSEFFLKYKIDNRWSLKAVYQFLFIEYKTETVKQKAPDGTLVDRFRNKANTLGLGVSYNFLK